jgi:hypothetical protein
MHRHASRGSSCSKEEKSERFQNMRTYEWEPGMGGLSGLGIAEETICRSMLRYGMDWIETHHPSLEDLASNPETGVALVVAMLRGVSPESATSEMIRSTVNACLCIRQCGWKHFAVRMRSLKKDN